MRTRPKQDDPANDKTLSPFFCSPINIMTDLTSLTLAEAREGLAKKSFTSLELTDAHLKAMEAARALNAFVLETPEQARAMARDADGKIGKGARSARRHSAGDQGPVRHQGRAHHGLLENPRQFRADLRIDGHLEPLARRRGHARQAQQ